MKVAGGGVSVCSFVCSILSIFTFAYSVDIYCVYLQGCRPICQISLGGSKFWLLKSTTVLMHRYIEIWKPTKSSLKVIMLL